MVTVYRKYYNNWENVKYKVENTLNEIDWILAIILKFRKTFKIIDTLNIKATSLTIVYYSEFNEILSKIIREGLAITCSDASIGAGLISGY